MTGVKECAIIGGKNSALGSGTKNENPLNIKEQAINGNRSPRTHYYRNVQGTRVRPEGPRQRKLTPFKVLVALLYGEMDYISWISLDSAYIKLGPLARFLGMPNYRLRDYLEWLKEYGYLRELKLSYGNATITINAPRPYQTITMKEVISDD